MSDEVEALIVTGKEYNQKLELLPNQDFSVIPWD